MKKLFHLDDQPLPALANSSYTWYIVRAITSSTLEIESNDLPTELSEKVKMLKINVSITDHEGALQVLENSIANTNSVVVELSEWNAPAGVLLGDAIVDGQRLSKLLINSGYANPIS